MATETVTEPPAIYQEYPPKRILPEKMSQEEYELIFESEDPVFFETWVEEELALLGDPEHGFLYYLENYAFITTGAGGARQPFYAYETQKKIIDAFVSMEDLIVGKVRQIGATTLLTHYFYWTANFKRAAINVNLIYVAHNFKAASEFIERIKQIDDDFKESAPWIHTPITGKINTEEIHFTHRKNKIFAFPPGEQVRGKTAYVMARDENARLYGSADPYVLQQACSSVTLTGGQRITISTGNGSIGKGELFAEQFEAAMTGIDKKTRAVFIPRSEHPDCQHPDFVKDYLATPGNTKITLAREYPQVWRDMFIEDPEGAVFDLEELEKVFELGRRVSKIMQRGGVVNIGIDWGDDGTGWCINRDLASRGIFIAESGTDRNGAPSDQVDMLFGKMREYSDHFGHEFYDSGGSGAHVNNEFVKAYGRIVDSFGVPFNVHKKPNRNFLMNLVSRTAEQCDQYDYDITKMNLYLAIDPDKCPGLAKQMRAVKKGKSGGIEKEDDQHEFDSLLCSVTKQRLKYFDNYQVSKSKKKLKEKTAKKEGSK